MQYQPKSLSIVNVTPRLILDDITVVIPTLGRPILEECLYWMIMGSAWPAQIIVVDQSSSSKVASWLQRLRSFGIVTLHVPSSQRGKAAALNRGIERTTTHFLAITDDDCFVEYDWLKTMMQYLCENPHAIITGSAKSEGAQEVVAVVTSCKPTISYRPRLKFDLFCGSNMGAERSIIEKVGQFDEDACIIAAEDCEWSYRALRSGVPIIFRPEVVVRHFGWRDTYDRSTRYRAYARSHGGFYGKYLSRGDWFIALRMFIHWLRALKRWLRGLATGNQELATIGRAYLTELPSGVIAGIRSRSVEQ